MKNPDLRNSDMSVPNTHEKNPHLKIQMHVWQIISVDGNEGP